MKIVINSDFGGYGLSEKAKGWLNALKLSKGKPLINWEKETVDRTDTELIETVEELGDEANGENANLKVVEIPDDVKYRIDYYDGKETIEDLNNRYWS